MNFIIMVYFFSFQTFKYDRFINATFKKSGRDVKNPVIGFGSLCPGKRYAICQLKWFVLTLLTRFDLALEEGQHAQLDSKYYGHEILPPANDVTMTYRLRQEFPRLQFKA